MSFPTHSQIEKVIIVAENEEETQKLINGIKGLGKILYQIQCQEGAVLLLLKDVFDPI